MKNKLKIHKIKSDIFLITEPSFKEFSNIFVFGFKPNCLIIDTGVGLANLKDFLIEQGYKKFKVTLTHTHFDHIGGLKYFSPGEIFLTKKIAQNLMNKKIWGLNLLKKQDFSQVSDFYAVQKQFKNWPKSISFNQISKNFLLGKFSFEILPSPGHTDDSVIFWDKKNGFLVTGDSFYVGKPYFEFKNSDRSNFVKTLSKIASLNFKTVLPGHNKILSKKSAEKNITKWINFLKL